MKDKKILFIASAILLLVGLEYFFSDTNGGKVYSSKESLCTHFAQSYLKTIPKHESNFNNDKWQMAVDVETDLYNLCLLDLHEEALKNFKPSAVEKYKDVK